MSNPVTGVTPEDSASGEFGANEWLVDEMYERYIADKESVDRSWWPILESYRKVDDPTPTSAIPVATMESTSAASDSEAPKSQVGGESQIPEEVTEPPAAVETPAPAQTAAAAPAAAPNEPAPTTTPVARTTSIPAKPQPIPAQAPTTASNPVVDAATPAPEEKVTVLKGMAKSLATNMDQSLTVPTATSVRTIPAKLMIDNRIVINNHLRRARGGKVSFTHLIAWAMVQTLKEFPSQNVFYREDDGKPTVVAPAHVNLGIAIDIPKPDGSRSLLVPGIKRADTMNFAEFLAAYEDVVARARSNKLTAVDFQGVTISLTNPGGIGTEHSVPRLMKGQGCIIGAGALEYPAAFQGSSPKTLVELGIGKTITLTSTYDHRVIQGAGSGEFL